MNILHLISSPKATNSTSFELSKTIIDQLLKKHPESAIQELKPGFFPHVDNEFLMAYSLPKEEQSEEQKSVLEISDNAIAQLNWAQIIVISLPVYNFGIPSALKAWIDQIARPGIAFTYDENGPTGLFTNKKVYLAISSGGVFSDGSSRFADHAESYLKTVLEFIGITDVTTYRAEGLSYASLMNSALDKAIKAVQL